MSDREKAGLRGPVRTCVEETIVSDGSKYLTTTEYSSDGRLLALRNTYSDGSEWVTTQTYDADGHLAKTISGKMGEPNAETLYAYDEAGRLLTTTNSPEKGGRIDFHYDEQGRKTSIRRFDQKTLERAQNAASALSPWDTAESGIGIPAGGKITTIYDENDQPTEKQIRDAEEHIVSRIVRTYDANGRLVEEKPIWENPISIMLDKLPDKERAQLGPEQIEQMNKAMGAVLGGKKQAGTTYTYDAQNRITKIHERNSFFEKTTTTLYNDHGDKTEERTTLRENSVIPMGVTYSIDENGARVATKPAAEVPASTGVPEDYEIHFTYQYDNYGNWILQTVNYSSVLDRPTNVHRKLTYY